MTERREWWLEGSDVFDTPDEWAIADSIEKRVHVREVLPSDSIIQEGYRLDSEELEDLKQRHAALVEAARAVLSDVVNKTEGGVWFMVRKETVDAINKALEASDE